MRPFYHEGQVEVDGETLHLVCNFRAIDIIESLTDQSFDDVLSQIVNGKTSLLTKVVWALLREKHEGVTLDEAAHIVRDTVHGAAVGVVVGDIFRRVLNLDEKAGGENPPKRRGRSKTSSKSGLLPA